MRNEVKETLTVIVVLVVAGIAVFSFVGWLDAQSCHARWERSGLRSQWAPFSGCMVERRDGTWLPASAIKDSGQ